MGTDRFKEDVSEAVKKFGRAQPGQTPHFLRVNRQEAMQMCRKIRGRWFICETATLRPFLTQVYASGDCANANNRALTNGHQLIHSTTHSRTFLTTDSGASASNSTSPSL